MLAPRKLKIIYNHARKFFKHKRHHREHDFKDFEGAIFLKKQKQISTAQV